MVVLLNFVLLGGYQISFVTASELQDEGLALSHHSDIRKDVGEECVQAQEAWQIYK